MKRTGMLTALTLALLLSGCGTAAEDTKTTSSASETATATALTEEETAETTASEMTTSAAETTVPEEATFSGRYPHGLTSEQDVWAYLAGTWTLLPGGRSAAGAPELTVFSEEENAVLMRQDDHAMIDADLSPDTLFLYLNNPYMGLTFVPYQVTGDFSSEMIGTAADLLFLTANVDGTEVMALRFLGNGDSLYTMEGFGYENETDTGLWVLSRKAEPEADAAQNDAMRIRDGHFYAVCYKTEDDACWLQELKTERVASEWGDPFLDEDELEYTYADNSHALTAVRYDCPDAADSGGYRPELVLVTTDAEGTVTGMESLPYAGYGRYFAEPIYERDPEIFGYYDETFLGEWECGDYLLTISEATVQKGGYGLALEKRDTVRMYGTASLFEGCLQIDRMLISGEIAPTEQGLSLTVSSTGAEDDKFSELSEGAVLEFTRSAG